MILLSFSKCRLEWAQGQKYGAFREDWNQYSVVLIFEIILLTKRWPASPPKKKKKKKETILSPLSDKSHV